MIEYPSYYRQIISIMHYSSFLHKKSTKHPTNNTKLFFIRTDGHQCLLLAAHELISEEVEAERNQAVGEETPMTTSQVVAMTEEDHSYSYSYQHQAAVKMEEEQQNSEEEEVD